MAVPNDWILSTEEHPERPGSQEGFRKDYQRVWTVITQGPHVGPLLIRMKAELPRYGDVYVSHLTGEYDESCRAVNIRTVPVSGSATEWTHTIDYSTESERDDGQNEESSDESPGTPTPATDPTLRSPKLSWSGYDYKEIVHRDAEGKWLRTTSGAKYHPRPERDNAYLVVTLQRFQRTFDMEIAAAYRHAVNNDLFRVPKFGFVDPPQWWNIGLRQAKMVIFDMEEQQKNNKFLAWCTYRIMFKETGKDWDLELLEEAKEMINLATGKLEPILQFGVPVAEPVPLDDLGAPLIPTFSPSETRREIAQNHIVSTRWRVAKEQPFLDLDLFDLVEAMP